MRAIVAVALVLGLIGGWSGAADARIGTLAGSWFADVTPQPAPPEFPEPPPPFVSILNFGLAGTVIETDSALNPNVLVALFPPDILPPFSGSDSYGSWKRTGRNRFKCRFIRFLFDADGVQIALITTRLDLRVRRDGTLEGEGSSDFIMGSDPEGEVFFNGPVRLEASRIRVQD